MCGILGRQFAKKLGTNLLLDLQGDLFLLLFPPNFDTVVAQDMICFAQGLIKYCFNVIALTYVNSWRPSG